MTDVNRDAVLAMDNPDFDWDSAVQANDPTPEPEPTPAATPEPTPQPSPAPEAATAPQEQPQPTTQPVDFGHIAKEIRESERAKAEAMAQQAYYAGLQAAEQRQQQQAAPVEAPDMYLDPEGWAQYQREQIVRELSPHIQQANQRAAAAENRALMAEAGVSAEVLQQAFAYVQQQQPWMIDGLNRAPNSFKALIDHARLIGFQAPNTTATAAQNANVITEEVRKQVLTEEAAKRAAAGQTPQMQVPRGVGSTPAGQGHNENGPPPIGQWENIARSNPRQWEQQRAEILKGLNGGVL